MFANDSLQQNDIKISESFYYEVLPKFHVSMLNFQELRGKEEFFLYENVAALILDTSVERDAYKNELCKFE